VITQDTFHKRDYTCEGQSFLKKSAYRNLIGGIKYRPAGGPHSVRSARQLQRGESDGVGIEELQHRLE
jgi:hypothetical protein